MNADSKVYECQASPVKGPLASQEILDSLSARAGTAAIMMPVMLDTGRDLERTRRRRGRNEHLADPADQYFSTPLFYRRS